MVKFLHHEKKWVFFFQNVFEIEKFFKTIEHANKETNFFCFFFPGISIKQSSEYPYEMEPVKPNRTLVLIYSCGAKRGDDGQPYDYVGNYAEHVFKMIGFEKCLPIKIEGVADPDKKNVDQLIERKTTDLANKLNKNFS